MQAMALPPDIVETALRTIYQRAIATAGARSALQSLYGRLVTDILGGETSDQQESVACVVPDVASIGEAPSDEDLDEVASVVLDYEDHCLAEAMLEALFEHALDRVSVRILGQHAALQTLVQRYIADLVEVAKGRAERRAGSEDAQNVSCHSFNTEIDQEASIDLKKQSLGAQECCEPFVSEEATALPLNAVHQDSSDEQTLGVAALSDVPGVHQSTIAPHEVHEYGSARTEQPENRPSHNDNEISSDVNNPLRGHVESLVLDSITAAVARSREAEVEEIPPDLLDADQSQATVQGEDSAVVAQMRDAVHAEDVEETTAPRDEHPWSADACVPGSAGLADDTSTSALPAVEPSWSDVRAPPATAGVTAPRSAGLANDTSASAALAVEPPWPDACAPPATAPGALSSMAGLEARAPEGQPSLTRQETFKALAALYGPAADLKLSQRQSVSAGSAWSTRSAWSGGHAVSCISTAPSSARPTPPSTAPPKRPCAARLAARAKCRAARQPEGEESDGQGSHLIHQSQDPIRLRQLDQRRIRGQFLKNLHCRREQERETKRQENVLQEYYWRMRDMQTEVSCRKQERVWHGREELRRENVERRRQELAEQSDEALNRRYGRFFVGPEDERYLSLMTQSSSSPVQKTKDTEMESLWEAEDLDVFQEAYQDAVGRLISPESGSKPHEDDRHGTAGPREQSKVASRQSSRPPSKQQMVSDTSARVGSEPLTWEGSLRSPMASASPRQVAHVQQIVASSSPAPVSTSHAPELAPTLGPAGPPSHVAKALPAGLVEWESWRNPWRGRRRGGHPPIEAVVGSLLANLSPTDVSEEATRKLRPGAMRAKSLSASPRKIQRPQMLSRRDHLPPVFPEPAIQAPCGDVDRAPTEILRAADSEAI